MVPTQSQIVTLVAGSALFVGVLYAIYLIRRKRQSEEDESEDTDTYPMVEERTEDTSQDASEPTAADDIVTSLSDEDGPPLPDKNGLTVSASWAILNPNTDAGSPHLSPVNSQESLLDGIEEQSESQLVDDTQGLTAFEVSTSESTILIDTVSSPARLSAVERETADIEEMNVQYEELLKEHKAMSAQSFTAAEIMEAMMAAQKPAHGLSERNAEVLVGLLTHDDIHLKHEAVKGMANCAAFTKNQDMLRQQGCLPCLAKLLELQRMALWMRHTTESTPITSTIKAVTNLAVNEQNNSKMEACVPTLVDIALDKETGEEVCMSSLQALTNLSVTPAHHGQYTRLVLRLYELLGTEHKATRLQTLKILINLSCNPEMVPHLLAAKAPQGLLDFLQPSRTDDTVILRFVTLLANILHVVKEQNITSSSLPPDDKAASPETMYTALLGIGNVGNLKNKVFLLCKHSDEEVKQQAARVYNHLK